MRKTKNRDENGHVSLCNLSMCQEKKATPVAVISELAGWRIGRSTGCLLIKHSLVLDSSLQNAAY